MTTAITNDPERTTRTGAAFNKPAYRYIRQSDALPPLYANDGQGEAAMARVKLFNPTGAGTWYLSEYDPETRTAFGITNLGYGPELGYVSMEELCALRGMFNLPIERDIHWTPRPLSECR